MLPQDNLVDGQCRLVECRKFVKHFSKSVDITFRGDIDGVILH